jgi:hypothetical protein
MRHGQAGRIAGPGLRQVEGAVDEGMAVPRDVGREDPDLAVGDLARRAGVLARHTAGRLALLEKASFVEHQHRVRSGQRLQRTIAHDVAQHVRLPAATAEDRLLPPWPRVARRLGPHPTGLAPLRPEQPIEELTGRRCHPRLGEQRTHPGLDVAQRRRPQLQRRLDRCTAHPHSPSCYRQELGAVMQTATVMLVRAMGAWPPPGKSPVNRRRGADLPG